MVEEAPAEPGILAVVPRTYEFLDHPGPIPFAHRGGPENGLENSMPAFQRAIDLGYRYLETDVHATADGALIVFHDRTLDRVTGRTGTIAELPYEQVAQARIKGVEPIPLLEDLLGSWPEVRVNIDVKETSAIGPLVRVLHRTRSWRRVCITSFSTRRLDRLRARLPLFTRDQVCTALGPRGVMALRAKSCGGPAGKLVRLASTGVACAQVPYGLGRVPFVTEAFIAQAHTLGLRVHAWTVNDPAEMRRLLDLGVDGIMTDELLALRDAMSERGLWRSPVTPVAAPTVSGRPG